MSVSTASNNGSLEIPTSTSTVSVSIIDATRMNGLPWNLFLGPSLEGLEKWNCTDYAFLITHHDAQGRCRRLVFDLGAAANFRETLPPPQMDLLTGWEEHGAQISVNKQIHDILAERDIYLTAEDALLWSHPHWDHIGNTTLFPLEVPVLVGPGVQETFGPGYPEKEESPWFTKDLEGRTMKSLSFETSELSIGGMRALDHFGDGSFYILDSPGHCVGHMTGLARVGPDSFIYLGADAYHHGSEIRPNKGAYLPSMVDLHKAPLGFLPSPCPADLVTSLYPSSRDHKHDHYTEFCGQTQPGRTPLLTMGWREDGFTVATDAPAALDTIAKIQDFDADDRIFCISSHDISLLDVMDFFPKDANNWKEMGWKQAGRWNFLKDFEPVFKARLAAGA